MPWALYAGSKSRVDPVVDPANELTMKEIIINPSEVRKTDVEEGEDVNIDAARIKKRWGRSYCEWDRSRTYMGSLFWKHKCSRFSR
jgi:hypothetical protein